MSRSALRTAALAVAAPLVVAATLVSAAVAPQGGTGDRVSTSLGHHGAHDPRDGRPVAAVRAPRATSTTVIPSEGSGTAVEDDGQDRDVAGSGRGGGEAPASGSDNGTSAAAATPTGWSTGAETIAGHDHPNPAPHLVEPIGVLRNDIPVPTGLGAVPVPATTGTAGFAPATGLAVAPSCATSCITSGTAYPRGFGAEIVATTTVPATLFMTAIADLDGDGTHETVHHHTTGSATTHSWRLDHLEPGSTYHAMVAATDEGGHTSYVWGTFTTLSQRDVVVALGDLTVAGGPDNVDTTLLFLGLDGPEQNVTPALHGPSLHTDVARHPTLDVSVVRSWPGNLCGAWAIDDAAPHGHSTSKCVVWNSTSATVDLDQAPAGASRWTTTTVHTTLSSPQNPGDALPAGYGDPWWLDFSVPVTLVVLYS